MSDKTFKQFTLKLACESTHLDSSNCALTAPKMKFLVLVLGTCFSVALGKTLPKALSQEMIDYVNSVQNHWRAGHNFEASTTIEDVQRLLGVPPGYRSQLPIRHHEGVSLTAIPPTFDSREQWPDCPSIQEVRDQGACGSCWALGAVEAMSDRYCILLGKDVHISAQDLLTCCSVLCGNGCNGGSPDGAWEYWVVNGLVTGGNYGSGEGCQPYTIASCDHHVNGTLQPCGTEEPTPACADACIEDYPRAYAIDKHFGDVTYGISRINEQIQAEIQTSGPVEVTFDVYEDFFTYESGVYRHVSGSLVGSHAVKMIGWGTENDDDYWLITNSWNTDWGENGFFKILRGVDECGIESNVVAGLPKR